MLNYPHQFPVSQILHELLESLQFLVSFIRDKICYHLMHEKQNTTGSFAQTTDMKTELSQTF